MNRAMYSGVAGLRTHQTRMDVIGNNIANVNTVGYKSQSALFAELLYQNSSNASGPNETMGTGGINPKQVGLGVKTASISTNITQAGSAETTNNPFDIRITGDSFFIVNNGSVNLFTRDGSFKVDAAGNLVMSSNGYMVMGWLPDTDNPNNIKPDTVTSLQIMSAANMTYPAEATTQAHVSGIIDAESPEVNSKDGKIMNLNFYDNRGYSYTAKLAIKRVEGSDEDVNSYSCELVKLLDASGNDVTAASGAKIGNAEVVLPDAEESSIASGYKLTRTAENAYQISYKPDAAKEEYIIYKIADGNGGVTASWASDENGTTPLPNAATISEDEAWQGVAKAFGYDDVDEFKMMRSIVTVEQTGGTTSEQTYDVGTQLGSLLEANKVNDDGKFILNAKYVDGCVLDFDKDTGAFKGLGGPTGTTTSSTAQLIFGTTGDAASFRPITIDFSTLSNVGNEKVSTAAASYGSIDNRGSGRMVGKMSGISIQNDGMIYAQYDNGQMKLLGQIAVASFANPSGLQKEGDNLYSATQNSGAFDGVGINIRSDEGYMTTGELEMSNVDLSGELTGMIITQRGFQANSRIITVSDTMLEELINLKR